MESKNCWSCGLVALGGDAFPGRCRWFVKSGKQDKPKDIPVATMDKGCKLWQEDKWDGVFNKDK